MSKIREKDRDSVMNAIAGGVTPRQGIQYIQVGRYDETQAILTDIERIKDGGAACRVVQGSFGSGKALVDSSLVICQDGEKPIGTISKNDKVLGTDGEFHRVNGVFPQGKLTVWRIAFDDGTVVECSKDHLWNVQTLRDRVKNPSAFETLTLKRIAEKFCLHTTSLSPEPTYTQNLFIPQAVINGVVYPQKAITGIWETTRTAEMTCISVDSDDGCFTLANGIVTHNTFFLTLVKTVALKQNMMTMAADFSPDRRLYSSGGQAKALYRELVRNLSSVRHPDGGALEELLEAVQEKVSSGDSEFLSSIRKLPYGYDAITACSKWKLASALCSSSDAKEQAHGESLKDAVLRWFSGENTAEHKKMLGLKSSIDDDGAYDALKMIAALCHAAGYTGLMVELDECVNLYKINNSTSRDRNYEQILRIFNECLQGDANYIGFIFGGTPEFVMDPRRGLFSYDALRSRLISPDFNDGTGKVDTTGPLIDLIPLSQEDLLVLLGNITNVEAMGNKESWLVNDAGMQAFLKKHFDTLGADYYLTPREILREYVAMLRMMRNNPEMTVENAIGKIEVKAEKRESGLGNIMAKANETSSEPDEEEDDIDFGF